MPGEEKILTRYSQDSNTIAQKKLNCEVSPQKKLNCEVSPQKKLNCEVSPQKKIKRRVANAIYGAEDEIVLKIARMLKVNLKFE